MEYLFGRRRGDRVILYTDEGVSVQAHGNRKRRVVLSRLDCELLPVDAALLCGAPSEGSTRHKPLPVWAWRLRPKRLRARLRSLLPSLYPGPLDGSLVDYLPPQRPGAPLLAVLIEHETLALYQAAAGKGRLTVFCELLRCRESRSGRDSTPPPQAARRFLVTLPGGEELTTIVGSSIHSSVLLPSELSLALEKIATAVRAGGERAVTLVDAWRTAGGDDGRAAERVRLLEAGLSRFGIAVTRVGLSELVARTPGIRGLVGRGPHLRGSRIGGSRNDTGPDDTGRAVPGRPPSGRRSPHRGGHERRRRAPSAKEAHLIRRASARERTLFRSVPHSLFAAQGPFNPRRLFVAALLLTAANLLCLRYAAPHDEPPLGNRPHEMQTPSSRVDISEEADRLSRELQRLEAGRPIDFFGVLADLRRVFPDEIRLRGLRFAGGRLTLLCVAPRPGIVVRAFAQLPNVERVTMVETSRLAPDGRTLVSITGAYKRAPAGETR